WLSVAPVTRLMSWHGSWITTDGPRSILGRRPSVNVSCVSCGTLACSLKWNKRNEPDTQQRLTHQGCSHHMPVLLYAIERMKIFTFVLPSCERNSWLGGVFPFSPCWSLRLRHGRMWQ